MQKLSDYKLNMKNKSGKTNKVLSTIMTALIIGMLIFVGPVDAYSIQLDGLREDPYISGETINFKGIVDIHTDEIVNIQSIDLVVNNQIACTFDVNGNELTPCNGIDVSLFSNTAGHGYGYGYSEFKPDWSGSNTTSGAGQWSGYGYAGYGYGYTGTGADGELVYDINIQTPQPFLWFGGNNRIMLVTHTNTQTLNSRAENVRIQPALVGNGNFLLGSQGGDAIFWGRFNSTDHTIAGQVQFLGSEFRMTGVGTYEPTSPTSGNMVIRFYDQNNPYDVGIFWTGGYENGIWTIHYGDFSLSGPVFLPPQ